MSAREAKKSNAQCVALPLVVFALITALAVRLPAEEPLRATPTEKQKANELWAAYRKATDDAGREQMVTEAAQLSGPAQTVFAAHLQKDFVPKLVAYGRAFEQAAGKARGKLEPSQMKELGERQAELKSLASKKELAKEDIEKLGDPAQAKLKEALLPEVTAITGANPALAAEREKLLALGAYQERLRPATSTNEKPTYTNAPEAAWAPREQVELMERTALLATLPISAGERQIVMNNAKLAGRIDPEEYRAIEEANLTRALSGLNVLALDPVLCACARDHSHDMQTLKFFSHESPVEGKKSFGDRAKSMGTSAGAENIFGAGEERGSGAAAHGAWFHSPGHLANLLGGYQRIGVGRSGGYFTEMLGW